MAKSLGLTKEGMRRSHCTGCLDYNYPFDIRAYDPEYKRTTYAKYTMVKEYDENKRVSQQAQT